MRLGFPFAFAFVLGILMACSPDPERQNFDYFRSPSFFRADTTLLVHPYCRQENPLGSPEACLKERKYRLTWERPTDTAHLKGYRIYLDTAWDDMRWNTVMGRPELASVILNRIPPKDSLVFAFTSAPGKGPDTLDKGDERLVVLDSNGRSEPLSGRLVFALVPVYDGGVTPGKPLFAHFVTTDRQPPEVFFPSIRALPRGFSMAWQRPTDRVSFFNPGMDTGIIAGYWVAVSLDGSRLEKRRKDLRPKVKSYTLGGVASAALRDTTILKDGLPDTVRFLLPDGRRSAKHTHPDATDSMYVEVEGLLPQDTLKIQLFAVDSAGNANSPSMDVVSLRTTDTTRPSMPKLSFDSVGQNGFTIVWSASRDSVAGSDGALAEAGRPNANIMDYRLSRVFVRDSGSTAASLDRFDTTIEMDSNLAKQGKFRLPVRFLPPGASFRVGILAEDSSGYLSRTDTLTISTLKVAFSDSDSVLACPPGFIPIPRGKFVLGDKKGQEDEKPKPVAMGPYCIEPYEHRDSTGQRFVANVTYEQAAAICRAIDSIGFDTRLCSEAEWERACEGPSNDTTALLHGIQSEGKDPGILHSSCNQSTDDSAMAMNFALRNPVCLTGEGVYDMAGNLSEWVRDTYVARAYEALPGDTAKPANLDHGFAFADSGLGSPHTVRGGNYLNPPRQPLSTRQGMARCSNRDTPEQLRPKFRSDCVTKDKPKLAVIYGPGVNGYRCIEPELQSGHSPEDVSELTPAPRDTSAILAFIRGLPKPDTIKIKPPDTAFKGKKPLSAVFTTRSLAVVTFERILPVSGQANEYADTLDATEMRDTSQAALEPILKREASNPAWTARKRDGKYAIEYLYAYSILGSKPALPYYSSRYIGFRCCSLARKPIAPVDTIVSNR